MGTNTAPQHKQFHRTLCEERNLFNLLKNGSKISSLNKNVVIASSINRRRAAQTNKQKFMYKSKQTNK